MLVVGFLCESVRAECWGISTKELHRGKENEEDEKESEEDQEEVIWSFDVKGRRYCNVESKIGGWLRPAAFCSYEMLNHPAAFPERRAQLLFVDLLVWKTRKCIDENDALRLLVAGNIAATVLDEVCLSHR